MATLAAVNNTLLEVSDNTKETSKGITAFVKYIEKQKSKDLEAERERKANQKKVEVTNSRKTSKSSEGFQNPFGGIANTLKTGGLLGLGSLVGRRLLRLLPGGILIGFADQIAETILGDSVPQNFKDTVSRGIQGAGVGMLLGRRFIPIFTALGLLATEENKGILKDIGTNVKEKWDKFAENLEPILGFLPSFDNIVKFIGGSVTKGLTAIRGFTESGFDNEEFKKNWGSAVGLLGSVAFLLMPGKFMKALKFLATFAIGGKGKLITKLVALLTAGAAGKLAFDFLKDDPKGGDPTMGVDDLALGTVAAGTSYLGFKAIKGMGNRSAPTTDDDTNRSKSLKQKIKEASKLKNNQLNKAGLEKAKGGGVQKVGGGFASEAEVDKALQKVPAKFERFAKFMRFPGIAALLSAYDVYGVLNSDSSLKEKTEAMGGIFGGLLGSGGGATLGAALGSVFPGPGTLLGGLIGGTAGYFAGEYFGDKLAKFLLGGVKDDLTGLKSREPRGISPGQAQAMTGSPIGVIKNDYNERLKNNMYNMSGIGDAGIGTISTGNKVNSENTNTTYNNTVGQTYVGTGPTVDLKDQFGFT